MRYWLTRQARTLPPRLASATAPVLRLVAALALLAAVIIFVSDWTAGQPPSSTTDLWASLSPKSHAATKQAVSGLAGQWLWSLISLPLSLPAYVLFGGLALLAGYAGRRRRTVRVFVN
ncbi:MAG: hypothetical protein AB7E80_16160 [Hyphomicrobiaceae bacterium]